jgi:hypothetical protein
MMKIFLILCFVFLKFLFFSQAKIIKKAYLAFQESKFELVNTHLDLFKEENGDLFLNIEATELNDKIKNAENLSIYYMLKSKMFFINPVIYNVESAYVNFVFAKKHFTSLNVLNNNLFNESCLKYNFCFDSTSIYEKTLDELVLKIYTKDKNIALYEEFLQKYPNSNNFSKVVLLRENYIIDKAIASKELKQLELCLFDFPQSLRSNELKTLIENIHIDAAILNKDIKKLNEFLTLYATSNRLKEIILVLENIDIDEVLKLNALPKIEELLIKYPYSQRKNEILRAIENINIDLAFASNDLSKLQECVFKYPNSFRMNELLKTIENKEIDRAIELNSFELLNECLIKYPISNRINEVEIKIAEFK